MKRCTKCGEEKNEGKFSKDKSKKDGLQHQCKDCTKQYQKANAEARKQYRKANAEKIKQQQAEYYKANAEAIKKYKAEYYKANAEAIKQRNAEYHKANAETIKQRSVKYQRAKLQTDPTFKLTKSLRRRLRRALKSNYKNSSAVRDLGCNIDELKVYLEKQFAPEMNWENYGTVWHIDHIIPFMWLDLTQYAHQRLVCHYTNLRPMFITDNLSRTYDDINVNEHMELIGLAMECCC